MKKKLTACYAPAHIAAPATRLDDNAGLATYTTRIAPMITLTWILIEQISAFEKTYGL